MQSQDCKVEHNIIYLTMHNTILLMGIIFLIGIGLVSYKYLHRKGLHDNVDQIKRVVKATVQEAGKEEISQNRLIKGLKQHLGVNEKMALKLIGKAKREGVIETSKIDADGKGGILYRQA